jgi:glycogen synthase
MQKLKTLVIAPEFAPVTGENALGQAIAELCKALSQEGWTVTVVLSASAERASSCHELARRLSPLESQRHGPLVVFEGTTLGGDIATTALVADERLSPGALIDIAHEDLGIAPDIIQTFGDQSGVAEAFERYPAPKPASLVHLAEPIADDASQLSHADRIVVSSAHLAAALRRDEEGPLAPIAERLAGIPRGASSKLWNPTRDRYLSERLDPPTVEAKERIKAELRKRLELTEHDQPLIAALHPVKLSRIAVEELSKLEVQLVSVGAGRDFAPLHSRNPGQCAIGEGDELAHLAAAAADFFFVGHSPFESSLTACRYGTAPIALNRGEAADRLVEFDPASGTGCAVLYSDPAAVGAAVRRAARLWHMGPEVRQTLVERCASLDLDWGISALRLTEVVDALL